jgi:hypothetical protein
VCEDDDQPASGEGVAGGGQPQAHDRPRAHLEPQPAQQPNVQQSCQPSRLVFHPSDLDVFLLLLIYRLVH